jgi:hypothetical protein
MFYTNGKKLIHKQNNIEQLKEACGKIVDHIEETKGIQLDLEITSEEGYPAVILPEDVGYKDLDDVLRPYIQLKAINEDSIYVAEEKVINEKYIFTEEEKRDIATLMSKYLKEVNDVEIEMKSVSRTYKGKIDELKNKINAENDLYTNGFTYKDYRCKVKLNFIDGKKYFVDKDDENIVYKVEKMDKSEKQLRIEHSLEPGVSTDNKEEFPGESEETESITDSILGESKKEKKGKKSKAGTEEEDEELNF